MIDKYSIEDKRKLQQAAGLKHLPTDLTYEMRVAVGGDGPRAYDWSDKPHRLIYDLCAEIEHMSSLPMTDTKPVQPVEAWAVVDNDDIFDPDDVYRLRNRAEQMREIWDRASSHNAPHRVIKVEIKPVTGEG